MEIKVKQISLYRADILVNEDNQEVSLPEQLVSRVIMDQQGNETERISYDSEGNVEERVLTKFEKGRPIEEALEINGIIAERTTREFDEKGMLIREYRHYQEGEPDEIRYIYDGDLLMLKQTIDEDGEEGEKLYRKYEAGLLVREESHDADGDIELSKTYSYNDKHILEEIVELRINDGEETRIVSVLDEAGHVVLEKRYDTRGNLLMRSKTTIGENGQPERIEEETVMGTTITLLEYDTEGHNTILEEQTTDGETISRIERIYDGYGRPLETITKMEPTPQRPGTHARMRYDYEFIE